MDNIWDILEELIDKLIWQCNLISISNMPDALPLSIRLEVSVKLVDELDSLNTTLNSLYYWCKFARFVGNKQVKKIIKFDFLIAYYKINKSMIAVQNSSLERKNFILVKHKSVLNNIKRVIFYLS